MVQVQRTVLSLGAKMKVPCRKFRTFNILPLASKFLPLVLTSVVDNIKIFRVITIHMTLTMLIHNLHVPNTNFSIKKEFIIEESSYSVSCHQSLKD
jgi:hypothetical protein